MEETRIMLVMKMIFVKRVAVLAFTGSMKATCANDIKRDIQLAQFSQTMILLNFTKVN